MGKKYLLYIHSEAFDSQQGKSQLVNQLLEAHYRQGVVYTPDPQPRPHVYTKPPIVKQPAIERLSNGLCKVHATPLDSRGRCLMKGCKHN